MTKKILYTSDLGNTQIPKAFAEPFEPCAQANLVIGETTYGSATKAAATMKGRTSDIEKMTAIIEHTCIDKKGRVLIPSFALDRLPELLTIIDAILTEKEWFIPIIVDTPLGVKHLLTYCANEEKSEKLREIIKKDNIRLVAEYNESKMYYNSKVPMIILSSSGMMTAGRVLNYLPSILKDEKNYIVFCGYASTGSLASIIKQGKKKYIKIGDKVIKNNCRIISLNSFSSHMQYQQLIDYYSSINCERIALVHGETKVKQSFAAILTDILSQKLKSTRVINVTKGSELYL